MKYRIVLMVLPLVGAWLFADGAWLFADSKYNKTCVKQPKIDKTKILIANGSLMQVKGMSECSPVDHSAILLTCIKR